MCIQICEINFQQLKFVVYREYFNYMERTFVFCPVNNRSFRGKFRNDFSFVDLTFTNSFHS